MSITENGDKKEKPAHTVAFIPSGRGKARCQPNPAYPNGVELDISDGKKSCLVHLPYPAPECGRWNIKCDACDNGVVSVTAAGRPDDPKSIRIPCLNRCYAA